MKIYCISLLFFFRSNCGIVFGSSFGVTQGTETTTTRESNATDEKNLRLTELLKGDDNEMYKTQGEQKNLDERSYVYIDQIMRRPLKKIYNLKLEKLTNSFMKHAYNSKRKTNVFPIEFQSQDEHQQQQLFVPNIRPQKYVEQNAEENKNYIYQLQQDKPVTTQKIKEKVPPLENRPTAPRPLSLNHDTDIHRGIKHKLFGKQYLDHSKPKRKFPFARHRLNYNYGIASYPMRRSALRNQVRQNAEKDSSASMSALHPANDKYVQLLEEIGNVIDLDVDDVMNDNVNENRNNNDKKVPCNNCFSIASEPKQKSRTVSLLGCTCENMNMKHEPFGKIIKMLDEKDQSTTESASIDYSMT